MAAAAARAAAATAAATEVARVAVARVAAATEVARVAAARVAVARVEAGGSEGVSGGIWGSYKVVIQSRYKVVEVLSQVWANGSFDKKRGRHDNERTELRLRDLGKIRVFKHIGFLTHWTVHRSPALLH